MSNLDNAIGKAFDDSTSDDTPAVTPVESTEVTVPEVKPEVDQEVPAEAKEESFTKVNPETLPEDLKGIYKSLLKDYTQKRQAESKVAKDLTAKITDLEQRLQELQQSSSGSPTVEGRPISPEEQLKQIARQTFVEEQEGLWIEQARTEYLSIDDRLNDNSPLHDPILDEWVQDKLDADLDAYEAEHGSKLGFDYKSRGKELIATWDDYISSSNKRFIESQKAIAKEQSDKSAKQSPNVSSAKGERIKGKMSLDEALEGAFDK